METSLEKDVSVVWQRCAFAQADILPIFGSSELVRHVGNEPQQFFAAYPSGFAVCPVGRGGCTSIILAQKIAAAGLDAKPGHKIAICLSPLWFYEHEPHRRWYVGNFSPRQASELIFQSRLSMELKRDFARRMLFYPDSVEGRWLLSFALHRLVGHGRYDKMLFRAAALIGRVSLIIERTQDHFTLAGHILSDPELAKFPPRRARKINWEEMVANAAGSWRPKLENPGSNRARFSDSAAFLDAMHGAQEWKDLELLLRTTRELQLDPLLLSIPIEYRHYEEAGVSRAALDLYGQRLHDIAARYEVPLVDFAEHRFDAAFFADHNDHLSALGWVHADRALDSFFHAHRR